MLLLSLTTDKLSLTRDEGGSDIDVVAVFGDRNQTTGAVGLAERQSSNFTTAATADIVNPPGATTTRNVKTIHIRNTHATTTTTVRVNYDANGTLYQIVSATLKANESLSYIEGFGWSYEPLLGVAPLDERIVMSRGARDAGSGLRFSELTAQLIPGLAVEVLSGRTYNFLAHITHIGGNVTTNGLSFTLRGTRKSGSDGAPCISAAKLGEIGVVTASVTAAGLEAGGADADGFFNNGVGTSSVTVRQLTILSGWFTTNVDGIVSLYGSAEADLSQAHIIDDQGTWLHVWEPTG